MDSDMRADGSPRIDETPTPRARLAGIALACGAITLASGCVKKNSSDIKSDPDALTAVSQNPYGDNRRIILWALSVTNPPAFLQTLRSPSGGVSAEGAFGAPPSRPANIPVNTRIVQNLADSGADAARSNARAIDLTKKHYQCWYAARVSPTGGEPTPEQLVRVFLDTEITQPIAQHFISADDLYNGLQAKETTRRVFAFTGSTLSAGVCGILPLIPKLKHGMVLSPLCAVALAAITNGNSHLKEGDATWGAAGAKKEVHNQADDRVDELTTVPFDVVNTLEKEVDSFDNDPERVAKKTNVPCPPTSQAMVEYIGTKTPPAGQTAVPGDGTATEGAANGAAPTK